jgi:hypothetical protein
MNGVCGRGSGQVQCGWSILVAFSVTKRAARRSPEQNQGVLFMSRIVIAAVLGLVASTSAAGAHDWHGGYGGSNIDRRQAIQDYRIHQGVRSGEITRREAYRLEREQAHIRRLERNAKADGYLSPYERDRIRAAQNAASRHIYEESHDGNRRWFRRWW